VFLSIEKINWNRLVMGQYHIKTRVSI